MRLMGLITLHGAIALWASVGVYQPRVHVVQKERNVHGEMNLGGVTVSLPASIQHLIPQRASVALFRVVSGKLRMDGAKSLQ